MPRTPKPKKPRQRRARGTGTVFKRVVRGKVGGNVGGKVVWIGRVVIGSTPAGRTLYREVRADTQKDCVARMKAAGPPGSDTSVSEWVSRWLAGLSVRDSTKDDYEDSTLGHIVPAMGNVRLKDVAPSRVAAFLVALSKERAASTVAKIHAHGRNLFEAAKRDGLIDVNPFAQTRRPKVEKKEINPFKPAELRTIIGTAAELSAGSLIALLAGSGCRLGEAAALDVTDWNEKTGQLVIARRTASGSGSARQSRSTRNGR